MRAVGIDMGSSTVKLCLFEGLDDDPQLVSHHSQACPLVRHGDEVEHDLKAMSEVLDELLPLAPANAPIGFSSAMHALVLLDSQGRPLANALSWAHKASVEEARQLAERFPQAKERTGTPLHPMAWPAKLLWLKNKRPELWKQIRGLSELKSYLLSEAFGCPVPVDLSNASATGLWDQTRSSWDTELCEFLEVPLEWLPSVESGFTVMEFAGRRVALGGGDGPISNLGVGAVTPGRLALSVGTSAAVRRLSRNLESVPHSLFRYHLDRETFVVGGALSNGTSVLDWLQQNSGRSLSELTNGAWESPEGAKQLLVYPYFSGERAPWWQSDVKSSIVGWSFEHGWGDIARASLEGVAYCIKRVCDDLHGSGDEPVRCTGGLFRDPNWCRLLADVLNRPLALRPLAEAGALGAALATVDNYLDISARFGSGPVFAPDEKRARRYQQHYARWRESEVTARRGEVRACDR